MPKELDMAHRPTRRRFLQSAAAAAALVAAPTAFSAPSKTGERFKGPATPTTFRDLNVAFVGVGGRGASNLYALANLGANVAALCDVEVNHLAHPVGDFPQAGAYTDFREMLATHKNI